MDSKNLKEYSEVSYCFLFYKRNIIVKESSKFLLVSEVEQLGIDNSKIIFIGTVEGNDYYAAKVSNEEGIEGYSVIDLGDICDEISQSVFLLALGALQLLNWFDENNYCSCCGKKLQIDPKKTYIECSNCGYIIYPRLTPAIIVAVLKGDKILLARSPHFPPDLYSLIAGHVEPGEFIENSVKREVKEEVGIDIKNIKYFGSHPWPFPYKLMLAFIAEYESGDIQIDNNEIEAADWFSLDDLPKIPEYKLSYARMIIEQVIQSRKNNG